MVVVPPAKMAGFRRASLSRLILLGWGVFAVGPIILLLLHAFLADRADTRGPWSAPVRGWLDDPESRMWAANSAMTAVLAVAIDLAILSAFFRRKPGPSLRGIRLIEAIPPLGLGVGALATPWLLAVLADAIGGPIGRSLRWAALELSPARSPGFLLILVLSAGMLPMLARVADLARGLIRPVRADAARMMGTSDRRAIRAGEGRWLGVVPVVPAFFAVALAATNLAPALLLTPFSERRTLAPAVLNFVLEADPIDPRIAGAIAVILAVNLLAFALASRGRVGPIGDWFRGR